MPIRRSPPPGASTDPKTIAPAAPKLRESCDPCATSKLKCSKEKPTCARCAKRGITCEYVATKRGGRKPINRSSISEKRTSSDVTSAAITNPDTPPNSNDQTQLPTPSTIFDPAPTILGTDLGLPSPSIVHGSPLPNGSSSMDFMDLLSPTDPGLFSAYPPSMTTDMEDVVPTPFSFPTTSISGVDVLAHKNIFSSSLVDSPCGMGFDSLFDTFPAFDDALLGNLEFPSPDSLPNNRICATDGEMQDYKEPTDSSCSCLIRALSLMGQLFPRSPHACMSSSSPSLDKEATSQPPTIDTVIAENEATVDAVGEILRCLYSHDGYLLTILSLIISKVLGRYATTAGHNTVCSSNTNSLQNIPQLSRTRSSSPTSSWSQSHPDSPIAGSYGVNGDHSARMAAQLVLSKLHRVRQIVNELSLKLSAQAARNTGQTNPLDNSCHFGSENIEMTSPLSGVMLDQLDIDLRTKLKMVSSQVLEGLRRL